jgi:hypothetical protein
VEEGEEGFGVEGFGGDGYEGFEVRVEAFEAKGGNMSTLKGQDG